MKLRHLTIHNFRGIHDQEIAVDDYTLLVGANNAGKSTVIDCIRAFYEKGGAKYGKSDITHGAPSDVGSWVELTFLLTDAEHDSLAKQYQLSDKSLRVRKLFVTGAGEERKPNAIYGYDVDGSLSTDQFYGAKNVQTGKFGEIVYIPAISKVDEHAKLTGPSALRDLLNEIMTSVARGGAAYSALSTSVETFSEAVRAEETSDGRSLEGLQTAIDEMLVPWGSKFRLDFETPQVNDLIRHMVRWHFIDDVLDRTQDIEQYGSGFQRYFIYVLVRIASMYVNKPLRTKAAGFTPDLTLLLFEEPEAFLHPPLQDLLAQSLDDLTSDGRWQAICSTHSSHFVSKSTKHIPSIARLSRRNGEVTARQIDQSDWEGLVADNQAVNPLVTTTHPDDFEPEMESVKYFLWLNPDRASVFFATHVLLVEGATEVALINRLIVDRQIRGDVAGAYVLDCMGKFNIHRFMNLLGHLGIPHSVIHDSDVARTKQDVHTAINNLIKASANDFTVAIKAIDGNLEQLLGLTGADAPKNEHRKPQHAVYRYQTGSIAPDRIRRFCELVEDCLAGVDVLDAS